MNRLLRPSRTRRYFAALAVTQLVVGMACESYWEKEEDGFYERSTQAPSDDDDSSDDPVTPPAFGGTKSSGRGGSGGSAVAGPDDSVGAGSGGTAGAPAMDGLLRPLQLTPIGDPNISTAHVSLYFTVTDAKGEPVPGLTQADFIAREDGKAIDPFESAFRVSKPRGKLVIPTVLLLDLSRSVVEAGALQQVKDAAYAIIDSLDPAQRLSIITFASDPTTRIDFTADKLKLKAAVDAIQGADGIATNLYGSLRSAYGTWRDGFYKYDNSTDPQLVSGLMIAVSDGNDTAGVVKLPDVVQTRGTKRTIFIRVGEDLDADVAQQIANAGVIEASGGFDELDAAVDAAVQRIAKLNDAIYAAEYCSPKRAGQPKLLFTVQGNEQYISSSSSSSASKLGGPAIEVSFSASNYSDEQCEDLFSDPRTSTACTTLKSRAKMVCPEADAAATLLLYTALDGPGVFVKPGETCAPPSTSTACVNAYEALLSCLAGAPLGEPVCSVDVVELNLGLACAPEIATARTSCGI